MCSGGFSTRSTHWLLVRSSVSMPRSRKSVVMSTREDPERNSRMTTSRSRCSMSPCTQETVKSRADIFSASQSTLRLMLQKMIACVIVSVS